MLSSKTIRGKTPEHYIEMCYEVSKWLEVFNSNGEDIFGEDYQMILAVMGIAHLGLSRPLNDFVDIAEKVATKINNRRHGDMLRGFGIKLEDDDSQPS